MIDYVIVTVISEKREFCKDMELPANLIIKDLSLELLDNLKVIDNDKFLDVEHISLTCDGIELLDNMTLASEGIWDGRIITIVD